MHADPIRNGEQSAGKLKLVWMSAQHCTLQTHLPHESGFAHVALHDSIRTPILAR